jgi:hypothetical protein
MMPSTVVPGVGRRESAAPAEGRRSTSRRWPWLAAVALCGSLLACAHPASSTVVPAKAEAAPLEAIDGDWVFLGNNSLLRVSNGGAVTFMLDRERIIARNFRLTGRHGSVIELEAEKLAHSRSCQLPFARQARFLLLSDEVGLFTLVGERPSLAFRAGPMPSPLHGRFQLGHALDGVSGLEVGPRAVEFLSTGETAKALLPVLAGGEHKDGSAYLVLQADSQRRLLGLFAVPGGNHVVEVSGSRGLAGTTDARFSPAQPCAHAGEEPAALPSPGAYRIEGLGNQRLVGRMQLDGASWTFSPFDPSSEGKGGFTAKATLVGHVGARASHLHLVVGSEVAHIDLRTVGGDSSAFVISTSKDDSSVGFLFREGVVPIWAPSYGLDKDLQLLCTELSALSLPATTEAAEQALERVGAGATSHDMRNLCKALLDVDPSMRLTMVKYALADLGRAAPTCAGMERLRDPKTPQPPKEERP